MWRGEKGKGKGKAREKSAEEGVRNENGGLKEGPSVAVAAAA